MLNEKKLSNIDVKNQSKMVHEILVQKMLNEIEDMSDTYGIDNEVLRSIDFSLFVTHLERIKWKGGKTRFVKLFEKELNAMIDNGDLTFEEVGLLTYLASKFTEYEDNILRVNDEYASKQMLIDALKEVTKGQSKSSDSYFKRILSTLEKKQAILSMENPINKRKKIYYLSPLLFYKGQYMDKSVKDALIKRINEL